jgi:hypothetical protein
VLEIWEDPPIMMFSLGSILICTDESISREACTFEKFLEDAQPMKNIFLLLPGLALLVFLPSCRSTEYAMKEKFGIEKRDILVSDVEKARDSQEAAKE